MKARILDRKQEHFWDEFIQTHPLSTIHQSSAWGHFQEKIPFRGKYWILVLENNSQIVGGTMLIRHKMPKGLSWLYAARGPLLNHENTDEANLQMGKLLEVIRPIAKKEKSIFLRIDWPILKSQELHLKKFKPNRRGFQPDDTLILDLTMPENELLAQMKPKGRYNIRLAEKKGVKIHKTNLQNSQDFQKDLNAYFEILKQTTSRDGFHGHQKDYYEKMLLTLSAESPPKAALYMATYNGQSLGGLIVTYFKDTATYYYGASSNENRQLMAPYLLQWKAIEDAKNQGYKYYDFFGIAPEQSKNHPWQGVTDFKLKFGGQHISYQKPQEYPFKKFLYFIYCLYKKIKRLYNQ